MMSRRTAPTTPPRRAVRSTEQAQRDFTAEGAPAPPVVASTHPAVAVGATPRPGPRAAGNPHQRDRWGPLSRNGR